MYILPACITFIHKTDSSNITNSFFCVQVAFTKSAHIEKIAQSLRHNSPDILFK